MGSILIYPKGTTTACVCAATARAKAGIPAGDHPSPEVTHLLLDVPSFSSDGNLRCGGSVAELLDRLPDSVTVIGGKLGHPALSKHRTVDLLQDPEYLAANAAITADCALRIAGSLLPVTFRDAPALVLGWGRIGKCLAGLLAALGCQVTVAARNPADRAMVAALGGQAVEIGEISGILPEMRLLFNTVPAPILGSKLLDHFPRCVKIDLASTPGLLGSDVVYARGLPGQYAPESSGALIARRVLHFIEEERL